MTDQPNILEAFGAAFLRTHQLVADAQDAQWQPSSRPAPRDDTTERSKGLVNDPTYQIFIDGGRRTLRADVIAAETALADGLVALAHAEAVLSKALGTSSPGASES